MLNSYDVYILYIALKKHFNDDRYDFIKYRGRINTSIEAFEKRKDKYYFKKLKLKKDPKEFLIANILFKPDCWIGDIVGRDGDEIYKNF